MMTAKSGDVKESAITTEVFLVNARAYKYSNVPTTGPSIPARTRKDTDSTDGHCGFEMTYMTNDDIAATMFIMTKAIMGDALLYFIINA